MLPIVLAFAALGFVIGAIAKPRQHLLASWGNGPAQAKAIDVLQGYMRSQLRTDQAHFPADWGWAVYQFNRAKPLDTLSLVGTFPQTYDRSMAQLYFNAVLRLPGWTVVMFQRTSTDPFPVATKE